MYLNMKASSVTCCAFLALIQLYHTIPISIAKTCNFPCHSRLLFVTVMDFAASLSPVISLGFCKTLCLPTAANE